MTQSSQAEASYRLLDTDVASYIFAGKSEASQYKPYLAGYIGALSFVTVAEMLKGAYMAKWGQSRIDAMEAHIQGYVILPYKIEVARQWASLTAACSAAGFNPGHNDAWIAASAVAFGCPVVARDSSFKTMASHYPALVVYP